MEARVGRSALWVRALLVGSVAFFLGVVGHVMADGLLPGVPVLVAVFGFATLMGVPLLDRRASRLRLVALLVTGQTFIHLCLSLTAGHAGDPPLLAGRASAPHRASPLSTALPVVDGHRVGSLQDAYTSAADRGVGSPTLPVGHLINDMQAHAPMMLAHLLAAALVGLWLAQGERHLWALVDLLGQQLTVLVRLVVPTPPPTPAQAYDAALVAPRPPRSPWLTHPDSRRGPPVLRTA